MTEEDYDNLVHGDYPPDLYQIPGTRQIDDLPNPSKLEEITQEYLSNDPSLIEFAREEEKDLIAASTGKGKIFIIGAGVAALVAGAAILIYKHKKNLGTKDDTYTDVSDE